MSKRLWQNSAWNQELLCFSSKQQAQQFADSFQVTGVGVQALLAIARPGLTKRVTGSRPATQILQEDGRLWAMRPLVRRGSAYNCLLSITQGWLWPRWRLAARAPSMQPHLCQYLRAGVTCYALQNHAGLWRCIQVSETNTLCLTKLWSRVSAAASWWRSRRAGSQHSQTDESVP